MMDRVFFIIFISFLLFAHCFSALEWEIEMENWNFLRIFHTPHFPHSAYSTPRIFHTPYFPHPAFSTLRIFHTPHFPHSALLIFHLTGSQEENLSPSLILCDLPDKQFRSRATPFSATPYSFKFATSNSCGTQSKALERSKDITATSSLLSKLALQSSFGRSSVLSQL